ncbi:agglutinin biogenesis protein MshP [Pseudoduganella rhizocola]|uniref:agglutinin biogenesis protein MshP n=1 Tax=Pseudoduganella rhizocola TaxID=3382643 RepID=UPI0038B4EFE1
MNASFASIAAIRRARGVGLLAALTILIILASVSVAVVSFTTSQRASVTLDEQQTRAYLAARSGMEWALFNWRNNTGAGAVACTNQQGTFKLPAGTSLSAFTVTVSCTPSPVGAPSMVRLRVTACNFPGPAGCPLAGNPSSPDYVERQVIADLAPLPPPP